MPCVSVNITEGADPIDPELPGEGGGNTGRVIALASAAAAIIAFLGGRE